MKKIAILLVSAAMLGVWAPRCLAQSNAKNDEAPKAEVVTTPIKVQIIFTEFEGDKKVKSLPYVLYHNAPHGSELKPNGTKLRIGSRIPVTTGGGQMQYIDVGTNLDCRAVRYDDGHFVLQLSLERSWVEGEVPVSMDKASDRVESAASSFKEPVIRGVRSDLDLAMRDGQTVESTVATDPLSGRVVRIEVTLNVLKCFCDITSRTAPLRGPPSNRDGGIGRRSVQVERV